MTLLMSKFSGDTLKMLLTQMEFFKVYSGLKMCVVRKREMLVVVHVTVTPQYYLCFNKHSNFFMNFFFRLFLCLF